MSEREPLRLYSGVLSHAERWEYAEKHESRTIDFYHLMAKRNEPMDLTMQLLVLAPSKEEAETRVKEHFGHTTEMELVPSGFAIIHTQATTHHANGVYGSVRWNELKICPECEQAEELRHDASVGETECVACGWSMSWITGKPIE